MAENNVVRQYTELATQIPRANLPSSIKVSRDETISYGDGDALMTFSSDQDCAWVRLYEDPTTRATLSINSYHPSTQLHNMSGVSLYHSAGIKISCEPQPVESADDLLLITPSLASIGAKLAESGDGVISDFGTTVMRFAALSPLEVKDNSGTVAGVFYSFQDFRYDPDCELGTDLRQNILDQSARATSSTVEYPSIYGWGSDENGNYVVSMRHKVDDDEAQGPRQSLVVKVETAPSQVSFIFDEAVGALAIRETLREKPAYPQLTDPTVPFDEWAQVRATGSFNASYPSTEYETVEGTDKVSRYLDNMSRVALRLEDVLSD